MKEQKRSEMLQQVEAIIMDMDGVLVDTEPIHLAAFKQFMDELQLPYTEKFLHSFIGYSIAHNVQTINQKYMAGRELDVDEAVQQRDAIYLEMIRQTQLAPLPGIIDIIDFCYNHGLRTALASSSSREQVGAILSNLSAHADYELNLVQTFHSIVTGDDVERRKPAPDIYLKTLANLSLPGSGCLAIEDSAAGVRSAKSAGLFCIALRNPFVPEAQLQDADARVDSLAEVVEWLVRGS